MVVLRYLPTRARSMPNLRCLRQSLRGLAGPRFPGFGGALSFLRSCYSDQRARMSFAEAETTAHDAPWVELHNLRLAIDAKFPTREGRRSATRAALLELCMTVRERAGCVWGDERETAMRYDHACTFEVALTSDLENVVNYVRTM